jgi:HJR/Mrr/RecB family endonuclease
MQASTTILAVLAAVAFTGWLVFLLLQGLAGAAKTAREGFQKSTARRAERKRLALEQQRRKEDELHRQAQDRARKAEQEQIAIFRQRHPAQIVGVPNLEAMRQTAKRLDDFIAAANSHRPKFLPPQDTRFRTTQFSYPFEFFFPRSNSDDDGPPPERWTTTFNALQIKAGRELRPIYTGLSEARHFPAKEPTVSFDLPPAPQRPRVELSPWSIQVVLQEDGTDIENGSDVLAKAYAAEITQANALRQNAKAWGKEIEIKIEAANEAQDLMEICIANENLKFREAQQSISAEFKSCKNQFEQRAAEELKTLEDIFKKYMSGSSEGVEQHFSLSLHTIALPLAPSFPWRVFYDHSERLIQVNQRVPFLSDIVVKRPDSNRAPAKRDVDNFLRQYVPAISLHIAATIAMNDWKNQIDTISVNCWSRYFEKKSGKLKDAFISSLAVDKKTILDMNVAKAEPLEAFRALRGTFVYSTEEVVPIEPQIRLDKTDDRFVQGKEILDGMAQGQNLATMDWQDFEHLIRELLAKEYGKDGSEVRITRASRDRGVDAVIFDPDPLRGGKYVVQAKRYNNLVDVSAVRDLYGTMHNEGAARGILVTTSKYGRDAHEFASNKPITLIDGQNLLSLLSKHGYQFKIDLTLS